MTEKIAVVGLGYVGLPVAVGMARAHAGVVGFDIDPVRVAALRRGHDATGELTGEELSGLDLRFTSDARDLDGCTCFVVTVPTPIDADRQPDLGPLAAGLCRDRAGAAAGRPGGVREHGLSGADRGDLRAAAGAGLGAAPGRWTSSSATRPSGSTRATASTGSRRSPRWSRPTARRPLARLAALYGPVVRGRRCTGAPSIRVAEAAKVIENTQRDLNIALMNELALICDRLGIRTARRAARRRRPSGTSCRSRRDWSAATASASTPTT